MRPHDASAGFFDMARSMGVRLRLEGERVKMIGPAQSLALIKSDLAANKAEIGAHLRAAADDRADCTGALIDPSGGAYLPWGPYLSNKDVLAMRAELVALIEEQAARERWDTQRLNYVLSRAVRGPTSDLLPNLHHFRARLDVLHAQEAARKLL
jgi:hypothetical protein